MARPRKSTLDAWLDQFAEWSAEDRAFALGQIQAIDRALRVAERRAPTPERQRQDELDGLMHRQQSMADATDPERNAALDLGEVKQ